MRESSDRSLRSFEAWARRLNKASACVAGPRLATTEPVVRPLPSIALAGILGLSGLVSGCHALKPPEEREAPADLTFHQLKIDQFKAGNLTAHAQFDRLEYRRNDSQASGTKTVITPIEHGVPSAKIIAGESRGALKQAIVELSKGVVYDSPGGDRTETEACTVNLATRTATGTRPVTMKGPGYQVVGAGFDAHFRASTEIQLKGGVHSVLEPEPPPPAPVKPAPTGRLK